MSAFDWPILMRAGIKGLGLKPRDFWELTPAELAFLFGEDSGQLPMDRAGLEALEARFPDRSRIDEDE